MTVQLTRFRSVALAALACGMVVFGAEDLAVPGKKQAAPAPAPKVTVTRNVVSPQSLASTTLYELLAQNVTMAAGASQQFYAQTDYTGVEQVSLGFYAAADQDLSNTTYLVWWAIPGASSYMVGNFLQGKLFPFLNTGGAQVPTYGNQLMIEMRNNGTTPVTITQITSYAIAR